MNETDDTWFNEAVTVVGEVIEFWGFKENHGRIWALIFLHQRSVSTSEIRKVLGLSKGATSMLLNELEEWGVVIRDSQYTERERFYQANQNFVEMISFVLERRESDVIDRTRQKLTYVTEQAANNSATNEQINALNKMVELASLMKVIVGVGKRIQNKKIDDIRLFLQMIDRML